MCSNWEYNPENQILCRQGSESICTIEPSEAWKWIVLHTSGSGDESEQTKGLVKNAIQSKLGL